MIAQPGQGAPEIQQPPSHSTPLTALSAAERLLVSPLLVELGVRHGFTTRRGGVSTGRYASLNLGETWGDAPDRVAENLRLVASDAGFRLDRLCQVRQVHGTRVLPLAQVERRQQDADGTATTEPLVLGAYSADCVCLLYADGRGRVAAVHAGWRGTVDGIAARAVETLVALGARPAELRVALGPSIGPCCFEVQEDVAGRFREVVPAAVERRRAEGERLYVDLRRTNRHFLELAGVVPDHIADAPPCTHCDPSRFFSYRRDGANIGQHLAFIAGGGS